MAAAKKNKPTINQRQPAKNNKNSSTPRAQQAQLVQPQSPVVNYTETIGTPRDIVIQQWKEDYDKLCKSHESLQNEYQTVVELNVDYTRIIAELQAVIERNNNFGASLQSNHRPNAFKFEENVELKAKIDKLESELKILESEYKSLKENMEKIKNDREKLIADEQKIFATLEMDTKKATIDEAVKRLNDLMKSKKEKDSSEKPLYEQINKIKEDKKIVLEKVEMYEREKKRLEFDIRQKNTMVKRLLTLKAVNPAIAHAKNVLNEAKELLRIATIRARGNDLPALLPDHPDLAGDLKTNNMYCMFCRSECVCEPSKHKCLQHYRAYRNGKWLCCGNEAHISAGCVAIPHCYVIKSVKAMLLTDSQQFLLYE